MDDTTPASEKVTASEAPANGDTSLICKLEVDTLGGRYRADSGIGSSYGGATFTGTDLATGRRVFLKYLICPRGPGERAKFFLERDALQSFAQFPGDEVAPRVLHFEEFVDLQTLALVTEWVDGELLSMWLDRAHRLTVEQRLEVFHRVVFAMSTATLRYQHRDFHPGNIMLLPENLVRMDPESEFRDMRSAVKVLDWGEALPVMLGNYEDEPAHNFVMLAHAPRTIGGALTSIPPEVFSPWQRNRYVGGTYESWGLGLLLYRVLKLQPLDAPTSLGDYASQVHSGSLRNLVEQRAGELGAMDLPGGLILPRLFKWMMTEAPGDRAQISNIGRVIWDLRNEKLRIEDRRELDTYFANPHDYQPEGGWKFSSYPDYD